MPTDGALLTLSQWLSPAFPVSAYAYSHGLEAAVACGDVTDADSARDWIGTVVAAGSGRNDAILLCLALRQGETDETLADTARALAGSAERWEETRAQGAAFAATLRAMGQAAPPDMAYPVALGIAARSLDLPASLVAGLFLQAFVGNLVSAAIRLVPLGQAAGQGILSALQPVVSATAEEASAADLSDLGGAAFGADLAAMRHETLDVRLFRT
ncbi:urease accessory protein UreF [Rhodobacterales bacterium HKCCE3408]|nr:urease accessory protein UreF [Rhodobacterales bacterium HKCCE3408]